MTSHCFVFTPLGYLCALEHKNKYSKDRHNLYVITTGDQSRTRITKLANPRDWDEVNYLSRDIFPGLPRRARTLTRLLSVRHQLGRLLRSLMPGDEVVVSHLDNPYSRLIIERAKALNIPVTVVDDGTSTLEEFEKLKTSGVLDQRNSAVRSNGWAARIEELLFSTAPIEARNVQFFSFWPLLEQVGGETPKVLERNELSLIHSMMREQPRGDLVFFVGQPFVRRGVIGEEEYNSLLRQLSAHYDDRGLIFMYFPHRFETIQDEDFDFEIVRQEQPFEIYLAHGEQLPRVIGGFFSATLATTFYFFRDQIDFELYWGHKEVSPHGRTTPFIAKMFEDIAASANNFLINRERI